MANLNEYKNDAKTIKHDVKENAQVLGDKVREQALEIKDGLVTKASEVKEKSSNWIQGNPFKSVALAALAGFIWAKK